MTDLRFTSRFAALVLAGGLVAGCGSTSQTQVDYKSDSKSKQVSLAVPPIPPEGTVVGTYLHGPLLPKNSWFSDWLTATALGRERAELTPLDDTLEDAAHAAARRAAGL